MKRMLVGIGMGLLLPSFAFGATFAKDTLFLSKNNVVEGETTLVHAIVSNDAEATFTGKLEISENDVALGSMPVTLGIGEASVVSVSWKPDAGSHTLVAMLRDSAGTVVGKESETFSIEAKKALPEAFDSIDVTPSSDIDSSEDIQKAIANISPAVAKTSAPVFEVVDSARESIAEALDRGTVWSKEQLGTSAIKNQGTILGTSTQKSVVGKAGDTAWTIFATIALYILSLLRYLVSSAGIFYPLLAILFFFMLWKLWRRYRRRR